MDPQGNSKVNNNSTKERLSKLFLDNKEKDIDVSMIEIREDQRFFAFREAVEQEICPRETSLEELELAKKIASATCFDDLMDCLSHKISTRTIDLMWEALKFDVEDGNVWLFIRLLLLEFNFDLNEVLGAMGSLLKAPYIDDPKMWSLRLWIVEKLQAEAVIEEFKLTKEYLTIFPENRHLWENLEMLAVMLGDPVMLDQLKFACDIIKLDPRHTYAWSLRCSMVMKIQSDGENRREREFDILGLLLFDDPWNECAWSYRKDLLSAKYSDIERNLKYRKASELMIDDCISNVTIKELTFVETFLLKFLDNNLAWCHRMWIIDEDIKCIENEMEFTNRILMKDQKNRFAWSWRRWIFERLLWVKPTTSELVFTNSILNIDKKNQCAWNYRQWLLLKLGGWEDEIEFCDGLLSEDSTLEFAWNQKLFVLENIDKKARDSIRMKEVENAILAILKEPNNGCPWMYLRGLYQQTESDDAIIDSVFVVMLSSVVEVEDPPQTQKELIMNVFETMLYVICQNYPLNHRIGELIRDLCSRLCPDVYDDVCSEADRLWSDIASVLGCLDPVNKLYWKWHVENVRGEALLGMAHSESSDEAHLYT